MSRAIKSSITTSVTRRGAMNALTATAKETNLISSRSPTIRFSLLMYAPLATGYSIRWLTFNGKGQLHAC